MIPAIAAISSRKSAKNHFPQFNQAIIDNLLRFRSWSKDLISLNSRPGCRRSVKLLISGSEVQFSLFFITSYSILSCLIVNFTDFDILLACSRIIRFAQEFSETKLNNIPNPQEV